MKKLLLITILAALLSAPQLAFGDDDNWIRLERQQMEWQQQEQKRKMERYQRENDSRISDLEWQQDRIENRQFFGY